MSECPQHSWSAGFRLVPFSVAAPPVFVCGVHVCVYVYVRVWYRECSQSEQHRKGGSEMTDVQLAVRRVIQIKRPCGWVTFPWRRARPPAGILPFSQEREMCWPGFPGTEAAPPPHPFQNSCETKSAF